MKLKLTIDQKTIEQLILKYVRENVGIAAVTDIHLIVKSKQNYRSEWESCSVLVTNEQGDFGFTATGHSEIAAEVSNK